MKTKSKTKVRRKSAPDITRKSIGTLIDELCTVSQKCWHAQDDIMNKALPVEQRLLAAERAQTTNAQRSRLMKAIDERIEGGSNMLHKTYVK